MGWQNDTKDQKSKQQSNVAKMQNIYVRRYEKKYAFI